MAKKSDDRDLRLREREAEPTAPVALEMDAAECRWDPWLLALARMEALSEARTN